jgi:hypothetical protein
MMTRQILFMKRSSATVLFMTRQILFVKRSCATVLLKYTVRPKSEA